MASSSATRFLFVINPISGGREKSDHEAAIKSHFEQLPHEIDFFILDGKNDALQLQEHIEKWKPHKVIAVGGDGTVTLVAKTILGTSMEMGIIPAGSANGMARELNIPININDAISILGSGVIRRADVIEINREICLHLSDIGLNARLIKYFEEGNMRGKLGYAKVALKVLLKDNRMQVIVTSGGKDIKRDALMVVLANASKYGTGAVINPQGNLYDGLFEVVIIRKLPVKELFKMWFMKRPFDPKNIEVVHAESVKIYTSHKVHFQVDGEYMGKVKKVTANIKHAMLNIILPAEVAADVTTEEAGMQQT